MPDYEIRNFQLNYLIGKFLPKLYKHFQAQEINVDLFVQKFFISIFSAFFPFDILIRIWDIFLIVYFYLKYQIYKINQIK
jgi:hypothetical protein